MFERLKGPQTPRRIAIMSNTEDIERDRDILENYERINVHNSVYCMIMKHRVHRLHYCKLENLILYSEGPFQVLCPTGLASTNE